MLTQNTGSFPIPTRSAHQSAISMALGPGTLANVEQPGSTNALDIAYPTQLIDSRIVAAGSEYFDHEAVAREIRDTILRYFAHAEIAQVHGMARALGVVRMDAVLKAEAAESADDVYARFNALTEELSAKLTPGVRRFVDVDISFG